MRLRAATETSRSTSSWGAKAPALQGERGLWRKSAEAGHASHYYSLTRMPVRGTVVVSGTTFPVGGLAWMDREWGTSALGAGQVGWDWFALQLADGRELMLYRLRRADGAVDPASFGSLIERDGAVRTLGVGEVQVDVLGHWTSPRGGRYRALALRVPSRRSTSSSSRCSRTRSSTSRSATGRAQCGCGVRRTDGGTSS
jgi:predicted secreted hydrolase